MCKIRRQYLRLEFWTLTSYFLRFTLLGEFLLPLSNILLCTYQDLFSIMKDIGMEYQYIDACPSHHIIYYGQYPSET